MDTFWKILTKKKSRFFWRALPQYILARAPPVYIGARSPSIYWRALPQYILVRAPPVYIGARSPSIYWRALPQYILARALPVYIGARSPSIYWRALPQYILARAPPVYIGARSPSIYWRRRRLKKNFRVGRPKMDFFGTTGGRILEERNVRPPLNPPLRVLSVSLFSERFFSDTVFPEFVRDLKPCPDYGFSVAILTFP